jgi:hypothetical protein
MIGGSDCGSVTGILKLCERACPSYRTHNASMQISISTVLNISPDLTLSDSRLNALRAPGFLLTDIAELL